MAKTFEVTAPDGHILEVTGPDDATQEQALAQAQKLYQPKGAASHGATGSWDAPAAPGIASQIWNAGKLPGPESSLYVPGQVAEEGAQMVKAGVNAVGQVARHPIDNLIVPSLEAVGQATQNKLTNGATPRPANPITSILKPAITPARGAAALLAPGSVSAPTEEENRNAAGGAFLNAAATALPGAMEEAAPVVKNAADYLRSKIPSLPSKANAGANFNTVMGASKDVPLDTTEIGNAAMRADELGKTGATVPKVIRDYINKFPADSTLTYETGRDFASNAGALSVSEKMAMNSPMGRQVALFAKALKDANRGAAAQAGMGELYDSAMREYALASHFTDAATALKEVVKKYGMKAAIGAGGYAAYKALSDH